ncbi:hypothetical protein NHX12_027994 [Muraenolepis orangiensis]|uniref:Uncharacterized protein n=1 Tax=Muraenolepis orangiensis TaxID=630683 RepID=A0A9Q0IQZ3_9TELE|nr:hypothetical protein NHX12_027994 [Muraenolepis orangiensis]
MARDWPRLEAQIWLVVNKERPLEEKVLADVRKKVPLQCFDRASVESPTLGGKIQRLRQAAQEQWGHLALIKDDLRDTGQERDSLRDITLTLPSSCPPPQAAGAG